MKLGLIRKPNGSSAKARTQRTSCVAFRSPRQSQIYPEPLPNGKAYQFYFVNEVKSFITKPSPGVGLKAPGLLEISGVAYSGKGRITKVMVSSDGGQSWGEAALQEPVPSMAFTRFHTVAMERRAGGSAKPCLG